MNEKATENSIKLNSIEPTVKNEPVQKEKPKNGANTSTNEFNVVEKDNDRGNKGSASKRNETGSSREVSELKEALAEREEQFERYAIDNDRLLKEKNETKSLSDTFQAKVSTLDKNLTEMLEKNTRLEDEVERLKQELSEAVRTTSTSEIHVKLIV